MCRKLVPSRRWHSITRLLRRRTCISKASIQPPTDYRILLQQVRVGSLQLTNCDFDSGKETKAAEYSLTDETYAKLLDQLAAKKFDRTSPQLRDNILNFYSDLSLPQETKKNAARWQNVLSSLEQLKLATPAPILAGGPALRR
jgi:hypothetical protein